MTNGEYVRSGPKPKPRQPCAGKLPGDYRHGERRTYKAGLCRGRACAEAASAYARQRYAARREEPGTLHSPRPVGDGSG